MSEESATHLERLACARHSHNLRVDERCRGDADYLAAAGMAARTMRVGGALMRLRAGGGRMALDDALDGVRRVVKSMNAKRHWRLNGPSIERVAEAAVAHYMAPLLPVERDRRDELLAVLAELDAIDSATQRSVERILK